jgi:hypothetical protein
MTVARNNNVAGANPINFCDKRIKMFLWLLNQGPEAVFLVMCNPSVNELWAI